MTEIGDIETAIDTLVGLDYSNLALSSAKYAALTAISTLLTALTDSDINGYDVATARAGFINAVDCIEKLITEITNTWTARFKA